MTREFKSMDGNNAAAYVSYAFTEVAGIYPITCLLYTSTWPGNRSRDPGRNRPRGAGGCGPTPPCGGSRPAPTPPAAALWPRAKGGSPCAGMHA